MRLPHLLGNSRLKEALASLPPSGVGSAVLLDGPAGIGKRTAAADLAAGLLCPQPNGPCGVCPSCKRASAGSHPDLIWLKESEPSKGVKLEQVRQLRAQSFLRPSEAPFKVFVIPQADRLNLPSQNALLKVLEEPASSVFVLLCENREAMLQTVRSRCKTFRLAPLEQQELLAELSRRCDSSADALRAAAAQSGGLLGRALDILSGQEKAGHTAARAFCQALRGDELGIFLACQELSKLHREEYADFCDESCRLLTRSVMLTGSRRSVDIFEYLEKQRAMLNQTPSVTALAGALAAFCGGL
ncbi:MAG: DNA polymerase III subunit delta [Clostridia bacterium]|nr:DNA polymerase III subunit delta [Clostridia bacterium]